MEAVVLSETTHLADRVAAGHFLFCLYSSARFSDTQHLSALDLDVDRLVRGFLEGRTATHKTSTAKEHRRLLLPLVALTQGLASKPWGPAWARAREEAHLQLGKGARLFRRQAWPQDGLAGPSPQQRPPTGCESCCRERGGEERGAAPLLPFPQVYGTELGG